MMMMMMFFLHFLVLYLPATIWGPSTSSEDFQSSKLRCSVVTFGAALSGELMETPMPDAWPQGLWLLRAMTWQLLRPSMEAWTWWFFNDCRS